jgi:hypothetical protein
MKIIPISLILIIFPLFIFAQLPNNSFEDWSTMGTYENPDQWGSLNNLTAPGGIFTCEKGTPGNPGTAYIKITSRAINGMGIAQGIAVSGIIDTTTLQPVSGFPFTGRPESMKGNWQFMAYGYDQGYISVLLTKWNVSMFRRDTVAYIYQPCKGMEMSWRDFTITLNYFSGAAPDSAIIVASASNANGAVTANYSYLYLDNLSFYGTVAGTKEVLVGHSFAIYPNPVKETLTVKFDKTITNPVHVEILNSLGQRLFSMKLDQLLNSFPINTSQLPEGNFTLKISSSGETSSRQFIHKNR